MTCYQYLVLRITTRDSVRHGVGIAMVAIAAVGCDRSPQSETLSIKRAVTEVSVPTRLTDEARLNNEMSLAAQGSVEAMMSAAAIYESYGFSGYDKSQAYSLVLRAADLGNVPGMIEAAHLISEGMGSQADASRVIVALRKAAETGDSGAMATLGACIASGIGDSKNPRLGMEWLRRAADLGDARGMYGLGWLYSSGADADPDPEQAVYWYQKSAELGNSHAMLKLGESFAAGEGVAKDLSLAVEWYQKAANTGNDDAMQSLGWCYANGLGVTESFASAIDWYLKAAQLGNANAMTNLGWIFEHGNGVPVDPAAAADWYQKAAKLGNAAAMNNLGVMYANGEGVFEDPAIAVEWYRKAADSGLALAMKNLGACYAAGTGVEIDMTLAVEWYQKAAELGNSDAMVDLANSYAWGKGVAKDKEKALMWKLKFAELGNTRAMSDLAVASMLKMSQDDYTQEDFDSATKWFTRLAETGDTNAMCLLGSLYQSYRDAHKNPTLAAEWYRKAANLGYTGGMVHLANCYEEGYGVRRDASSAVFWYTKASMLGDSGAQWGLGKMYSEGKGVAKDDIEAYKWLNLGSVDSDIARKERDALARSMTAEQIAEAQARSASFRAVTWEELQSLPALEDEQLFAQSQQGARHNRPTGSATAVFITVSGYAITSAHVVVDRPKIELLWRSEKFVCSISKLDVRNDLAILKAEGTFESVPINLNPKVSLGSEISVVGFPNIDLQGTDAKATRGNISALSGPENDPRYFQISAPIQPGNSGSGLIDEQGIVIGIVAGALDQRVAVAVSGTLSQNVNYAVKSYYLAPLIELVPELSQELERLQLTPTATPEAAIERLEKRARLLWSTECGVNAPIVTPPHPVPLQARAIALGGYSMDEPTNQRIELYSVAVENQQTANQPLQCEVIPVKVRNSFVQLMEDSIGKPPVDDDFSGSVPSTLVTIRNKLRFQHGMSELHKGATVSYQETVNAYHELQGAIRFSTDTSLVVDTIQVVLFVMISVGSQRGTASRAIHKADLLSLVNNLFRKNGVGFRFEDNAKRVLRVDSEYLYTNTTGPAISLLSGAEFVNANREFESANSHYLKSEYDDCLLDAGRCFESVIKIICEQSGWSFPEKATAKPLLDTLFENEFLPRKLTSHFTGLRSLLEGGPPAIRNMVGHGQGSEAVIIPHELAGFMLHSTAAAIVLLVETHRSRIGRNSE